MPRITEYKLRKTLKEKNFSNIYFLYGEEKYLVKHYTKKISGLITEKSPTKFNLNVLDGENLDTEKLYNSLESLPVFSRRKCIVVNNFSFDNFSKDQITNIKKIIEEILDTTFLIISQRENFEGKLNVRQSSLLSFFEKNGSVVEFKRLTEKELTKQLTFWAKHLGVELSSKCALKLVRKSSKDLEALKNELLRLCAFSNYSNIEEEMLDLLVQESTEDTIFSLSNEIVSKRYDRAFLILNNLILNRNDPATILAIISSTFVDIYRVKIAKKLGKNIQSLSEELNYSKNKLFRLKIAEKQCDKFDEKTLLKYIKILISSDFLLKNSSLNKGIIIEKTLAEIFNA